MYYRIKALHELGFDIDLHCFEYGRGVQPHLEEITSRVYYYRRDKNLTDWFSPFPFIVKTRRSTALLERLLEDDAPILFEGIHSTFYLGDERLKDRIKIVRAHNVEHDYYAELAKQARGAKKRFFKSEARKLKKYEPVLQQADHILAIQQNDLTHFKQYATTHLLPASIPPIEMDELKRTDPYCLFHGNLSVAENENAALWIIAALRKLDVELVIAGKNPSDKLYRACEDEGVDLVANPNDEEMSVLIQEARVHVLYTDQPTGLKLKLLNALTSSGRVIVNKHMIQGTNLGSLCMVHNSADTYAEAVKGALENELSKDDYMERRQHLKDNYDTVNNCRIIERLASGK